MRWKKNGFSYLIWVLYLLTVTLGLLCLGNVACGVLGVPSYWGIAGGILWLFLAGAAVYGLHVLRAGKSRRGIGDPAGEKGEENRRAALVAETSLVVILLAAGLILRIGNLDQAGQGAVYFENASVATGQSIPETARGAVWLYIQFLHAVFYFLGNKMILAVFFQILLQLTALLLLYLVVRRCAGKIGGMVFLSLCVFSGYLRGEALALSPVMLYLVVWAAVLLWTVTEDREEIHLFELFLTGFFLGIACYLDIAGAVLLPLAAGAVWCLREKETEAARKAGAMGLCVLGLLAGFGIVTGAEAFLGGKGFGSALQGWLEQYASTKAWLPVMLGESSFPTEYLVLAGLMSFGIFGFWRDRESEGLKGWGAALIATVLLGVFGYNTEELPAAPFLYLLAAILAGISVEEILRPVGRTETATGKESAEEQDIHPVEKESPEARKRPYGAAEGDGGIQFLENPLPLPKKHVPRKLDYRIQAKEGGDDYDLTVDENDDFDL